VVVWGSLQPRRDFTWVGVWGSSHPRIVTRYRCFCEDYDCALRHASGKSYIDIVTSLLKQKAYIHVYNDGALRWANFNGHTEIVALFLEHKAHGSDDYAFFVGELSWSQIKTLF
jgi:hypothetical protein